MRESDKFLRIEKYIVDWTAGHAGGILDKAAMDTILHKLMRDGRGTFNPVTIAEDIRRAYYAMYGNEHIAR